MTFKMPRVKMNFEPSEDPGITFEAQGRTKQSFKDECDINNLLKRYEQIGQMPPNLGQYGDFSSVPDYQQSLEIISAAENQFMTLDARLRARFQNDPSEFLAFVGDPRNIKEMVAPKLAPSVPTPHLREPLSGTQTPAKPTAKAKTGQPLASSSTPTDDA